MPSQGGANEHESSDQPIAIVGIGGLFPGSGTTSTAASSSDLDPFWALVENGESVARQAPPGRWQLPADRAFEAERGRSDRVYSRRACFLEDYVPDLEGLGLERGTIDGLDPTVALALHVGAAAWRDTVTDNLDRSRVSVILGNIALPTDTASAMADWYLGRPYLRRLIDSRRRVIESGAGNQGAIEALASCERYLNSLRPVDERNRFALASPAAKLADALGLGGGHLVLDAACASSLFALKLAVDQLQAGRVDAVLAGGLSRPDSLYTQMGFSQLMALSPSGVCSPFDLNGDGLVVGEGAGIVVLKRLYDALDQDDQIYAVIRGIGLSNDVDGRLLAPSEEGQLRALRSAYLEAGWSPTDVDLIECHATGTPIGDSTELQSLLTLWRDEAYQPGQAVVGSVKSNVGHLLTGAGAAGLIKTLLSMEYGVLPATANFKEPIEALADPSVPFRVLAKSEAWEEKADRPRRAAVSGFGFGGTNAHVLLEEWRPASSQSVRDSYRSLRKTGEQLALEPPRPVDIVGLGARLGPFSGIDRVRRRLLGARSSSDPQPQPKQRFGGAGASPPGWYVDDLEIELGEFRVPPRELLETLPQQLVLLQVAKEALERAGLLDETGRILESLRLRTGVFVGLGLDFNTTNFHLRWSIESSGILDGVEDEKRSRILDAVCPALNANRTVGALGGIVASRVAREFALGGPCFVLGSEESSGLSALEVAVRALQKRELDVAVVGAVDLAGDPRTLLPGETLRPSSPSGVTSAFDRSANGAVPGEGAVALILMRRGSSVVARRVHASILGIGAASGVDQNEQQPSVGAYRSALERAYRDARVSPSAVSLISTRGTGSPSEDRIEARALSSFFAGSHRTGATSVDDAGRPFVTSGASAVGDTGAVSGLVALLSAVTALDAGLVPTASGVSQPRAGLEDFRFASQPRYWFARGAKRLAGVSSFSSLGNCSHVVVQGVERSDLGSQARSSRRFRQRLGPVGEALFFLHAEDRHGLVEQLQRLADLAAGLSDAAQQELNGGAIESLARQWFREQLDDGRAAVATPSGERLVILARKPRELLELIATARRQLASAASTAGADGRDLEAELKRASAGRLFFTVELPPARLAGTSGQSDLRFAGHQIAFVYPGSGSHFPGMGSELGAAFPEIFEELEAEWPRLYDQLGAGSLWRNDSEPDLDLSPRRWLLAQTAFGMLTTRLLARFGVNPHAAIGYSLGECTAMLALGVWSDRDTLLDRVMEGDLFTEQLAGPCLAARKVWQLADDQVVNWTMGVIDRSADRVRQALRESGLAQCYVLISNTDRECVVGGQRNAVEQLVADLGSSFHRLLGTTTVHCPVLAPVREQYRDLHCLPTLQRADVRFYSGAWGRSYEPTSDQVADAIVDQALIGVDYPAVLRQAHQDGATIFVEMGPGASCTRMTREILPAEQARGFSVSRERGAGRGSLLRLLANLIACGVSVDLSPLYGDGDGEETGVRAADRASRQRLGVSVGLADPLLGLLEQEGLPEGVTSAATRIPDNQELATSLPPLKPSASSPEEPSAGAQSSDLQSGDSSQGAPEHSGRHEHRGVSREADDLADQATSAMSSEAAMLVGAEIANEAVADRAAAHQGVESGRTRAIASDGTDSGGEPTSKKALDGSAPAVTSSEPSVDNAEILARFVAFEEQVKGLVERQTQLMALVRHSLANEGTRAGSSAGLENSPVPALEAVPRPEPRPIVIPDRPPVALDREQCVAYATGPLAPIFGRDFAAVDTFPTRVRLPDEPLMLVDRVVSIEAEPLSMSSGRIVTEHDVEPGRWYLEGTKMPTCIAVESGQADLMLSGYLGIDLETRGLAVYRLLDAVVTFHRDLPSVGETIHYDIRIERFFQQGETWLFRFGYDATIDGVPLMTMRDGCAGFFTEAALAAGQGIVRSSTLRARMEQQEGRQRVPADWRRLVSPTCTGLDEQRLDSLRAGDFAAAFGEGFSGVDLEAPLTLPSAEMRLVHRITQLDLAGGRFGAGLVRGEADIAPDDWFLTCHFIDDMVMPGTLMYECCLHTLRVLLSSFGWVGEASRVSWQPVPGIQSRLKCRGQVLESTRLVTYEIEVKELGYGSPSLLNDSGQPGNSGEPYAIVDALMYADGKPIVEIEDMSLRLVGTDRATLEGQWSRWSATPQAATQSSASLAVSQAVPVAVPPAESSAHPSASSPQLAVRPRVRRSGLAPGPGPKPAVYDYDRILAYSAGNPSEAFGPAYRVFDNERKIARLPRPPFQFLDRITEVEGKPFELRAGAKCEAQFAIDESSWFFTANRQAEIPFAILLEVALQPCGWLAAYCGSALTSETDLKFRNLGGEAALYRPVTATHDLLTTRVEMTDVSTSGGMIIQHYTFDLWSHTEGRCYSGKTYFGFFSANALATQVGIRGASLYQPTEREINAGRSFALPREAPFPDDKMRMLETVDLCVADGGPHGLGLIEGSIEVDPSLWFFDAHFYEDPVWPGSLGLEAFLQLLKVVAWERWGEECHGEFATVPLGAQHSWVYRGQVTPDCSRVTVQVVVTRIDDERRQLVANGYLKVDDRVIYEMTDFTVALA